MINEQKLKTKLEELKVYKQHKRWSWQDYENAVSFLNSNHDYKSSLFEHTRLLDSSVVSDSGYHISIEQRIFYILEGHKEIQRCKVCRTPLTFKFKHKNTPSTSYMIVVPYSKLNVRNMEGRWTPTICTNRSCIQTYHMPKRDSQKEKESYIKARNTQSEKIYRPIKDKNDLRRFIVNWYKTNSIRNTRILSNLFEIKPKLKKLLIESTSFLTPLEDGEITTINRINALYHNIKRHPKCSNCGTLMPNINHFIKQIRKESERESGHYCSLSCQSKKMWEINEDKTLKMLAGKYKKKKEIYNIDPPESFMKKWNSKTTSV